VWIGVLTKSIPVKVKKTINQVPDDNFQQARKEYLKDYEKRNIPEKKEEVLFNEKNINKILKNYTCIGKEQYRKDGTDNVYKLNKKNNLYKLDLVL